MSIHKKLIDLGLTEQEASIYIATLTLGTSKASTIAAEVGIKRTTVYHELKLLAQKGFVIVQFVGKERRYRAQNPQKLLNHFQRKVNTFEEVIPQLQALERKHAQSPGIRFIETVPELNSFYEGILEEYSHREYKIIGDTHGWYSVSPDFLEQFREKRAQAKIKTQLLLTANSRLVNPTTSKLLREVRYLPEGYKCKSTIDIFDDKILIVSPEFTSLAVVLEIPAMTDVFKMLFNILWSQGSSQLKM
jgi:sugar-specific transcriptional regulator TrmB